MVTHALDDTLKAFYNVCRHRAGQVALTQGQPPEPAVQVPRLDLRVGRRPARVPRDGGDGGFPKGGLRAEAGAGGAVGPVRLRQPGSIGPRAGGGDGGDPGGGGCGRLRRGPHAAGGAPRVRDRVQLEGVRRQLPGGVPPADRAPAAVPRARLRQLPRRGVPLLLQAARTDPGAARGGGAGASTAATCARPMARRTRSTTGSSRTRCSTSTRTTCPRT